MLKNYFKKIFVINLPYKSDRRDRLVRHLEEVGLAMADDLTWVRAISGDWCPPPSYFEAGRGAWGCLQSHTRIVQDAIMEGLENYLVLEDDVIFHERSPEMFKRMMEEVPSDWDQIYFGGQHLRDPEVLTGRPFVHRCRNVNRTHAFALNRKAFGVFQQHITSAPDYIKNGAWHVDHQLGVAHERGLWNTYSPSWWIAGQDEGASDITGRQNPKFWWHPNFYSKHLPFIYVPVEVNGAGRDSLKKFLHLGCKLKYGTFQDEGLNECVGSPDKLSEWLAMIAREAMDRYLLPAIQHPDISYEDICRAWGGDVHLFKEAKLASMLNYPFNGLFPHALNDDANPQMKAFHSFSGA